MVIRYNYIKKIKTLFNDDYFYSFWLNNNLKFNNIKNKIVKLNFIFKKKIINIFRYFFWIFFYLILNKKITMFINYYKYLLNYFHIVNYFKNNNIRYYMLYYIYNLNFIKKNKKIQRKFINYLILKKKINILFFFKQNSFKIDFFFNSLKKDKLNIIEINLINPKNIYFFIYLNNLI